MYHFLLTYPIDISIYHFGYPKLYQESNNQCLGDYTVVSANLINSTSKGITCSRKDSTSSTGTWTHSGKYEVKCNTGSVRCTKQAGSVTLYTVNPVGIPENYKCCIEGMCASIRIWQPAKIETMFHYGE